jgi:type IV pilus assembly protein PilA
MNNHQFISTQQNGFTLIELMIVVIIIGILSAVAIPAYKGYVTKTELATGAATVRNLLTNIDIHHQENGSYSGMSLADIGATADMNNLGVLSLSALTVSSAQAVFTYDDSSINTAVITYAKSSTGWACTITPNSATAITADTLPPGC